MIHFLIPVTDFHAPTDTSKGSSPGSGSLVLRASAALVLALIAVPALTQTAPDLGSTSPFAIVSETFSNTTAGTTVDGDVCFTTGPAVDPTVTGSVSDSLSGSDRHRPERRPSRTGRPVLHPDWCRRGIG